jgi:hypothetical protein
MKMQELLAAADWSEPEPIKPGHSVVSILGLTVLVVTLGLVLLTAVAAALGFVATLAFAALHAAAESGV